MGADREHEGDFVLEVIACTIEDAVEAEHGGADRIEVVSRLDLGGLTPSLDLVRGIKSTVSLPLRVMLRNNADYEVHSETEIQALCAAAAELDRIGVDGIVLGFLKNSEIDLEPTRRILKCAPNQKATFHHAFEDAKDKTVAIQQLKGMQQIDKLLSHGGLGNSDERAVHLRKYSDMAKPEIEILVGGGVNADAIRVFKNRTSLREFHVGGAVRKDGKVDRSLVEKLVITLR